MTCVRVCDRIEDEEETYDICCLRIALRIV